MILHDTVALGNVRRTADGYLVTEAKVARTGIQTYTGAEVGKPDMASVRVYRPEAEVFTADALRTYAHRPVTLGHPPEPLTADNWKTFSRGQTGGDVVRDGAFVRVPLVIMDAETIRTIEGGVRELSMGYSAELEFTDGKTPDGEPYDAIQRKLVMNHLAVVAKARGGSNLKIGDSKERSDMADAIKTKTVLVDGLPIETTDAGALVIEKLQKDAEALRTKLADADTANAKVLATKDAEIDALKAKVLTDAQIDARAAVRADLIAKAKALVPAIVTDAKPDALVRREVVVAKLGDAAAKDKSADYVDARFDILVEDAIKGGSATDPVRTALANAQRQNLGDSDKAYADYVANLNTAYRGEARKEA